MSKMKDAKALIKSKCYILVTDKEATMSGDFRGFDGLMKIHALKEMMHQAEKLLKKLGASPPKLKKKKEAPNAGNRSGRKTSSPKK